MPDFFNEKEKIKWDEKTIEDALELMVSSTGQKTMPTHKEINEFFGNYKLSNAIRRNGGTAYWAQKMGFEIKECESKMGENYEDFFVAEMLDEGFDCERANIGSPRFPYDVIVDGSVKVDVKSGRLYSLGNGSGFYTFNIEKKIQTCDVFVLYCVGEKDNREKYVKEFYTIPASILSGKTQVSFGLDSKKYRMFKNNYNAIYKMVEMGREFQKEFEEGK